MINIIKTGKMPKKYKTMYTVSCPICDTMFTAEHEDFILTSKNIGMPNWDGFIGKIKCPFCDKVIESDKNNTTIEEIELKEKQIEAYSESEYGYIARTKIGDEYQYLQAYRGPKYDDEWGLVTTNSIQTITKNLATIAICKSKSEIIDYCNQFNNNPKNTGKVYNFEILKIKFTVDVIA